MPSPEYFVNLARQLETAKHGGKGQLIDAAAKVCGSRSAVYRGLEQAGWQSNRQRRNDKGTSMVTCEHVKLVMTYVEECKRNVDKEMLPLGEAIADLKAQGLLPAEASESTVRRVMESYSIAPKQMRRPAPHTSQRSLHPNHVHELDPSVCILWRFGDKANFEYLPPNEVYKNKPDNIAAAREGMIWRYALTDHTSGYISLFYIQAAGEGFTEYFNALMYFWGQKSNTPFHGVPTQLKTDRIGAMRKAEMQSLLEALGVTHIVAQHPRAKGQVECANNIIETSFEARLRGKLVKDINHLNQLATRWEGWYNGTKAHRRHARTRVQCWQTILDEQIRALPDINLCRLMAEPQAKERTVTGDLSISFSVPKLGKHQYMLRHIAGLNVGDKVKVQAGMDYPTITVIVTDREGVESRYQVEPVIKDQYGFNADAPVIGESHQAAPDTPREVMRKEAKKAAYGVETQAEADKARKANAPIFDGAVDTFAQINQATNVTPLPRPGKPVTPNIELPRHSPIETLMLLSNHLGRPLTAAEGEQLRGQYPEGCTDAELEILATTYNRPQLAAVGE